MKIWGPLIASLVLATSCLIHKYYIYVSLFLEFAITALMYV